MRLVSDLSGRISNIQLTFGSAFKVTILVHDVNGIARLIYLPRNASFSQLVSEVRAKLNDNETPLNLRYQTSFPPKTIVHGLDSAEEWEELLKLAFANRKKVKGGEHHVKLLHFLDDERKQSKGKGGKAIATGNKVSGHAMTTIENKG
jgi:hypothetical protein